MWRDWAKSDEDIQSTAAAGAATGFSTAVKSSRGGPPTLALTLSLTAATAAAAATVGGAEKSSRGSTDSI